MPKFFPSAAMLTGSVVGLIYLSPIVGDALAETAHYQGDNDVTGVSGRIAEGIDFFGAQKAAGIAIKNVVTLNSDEVTSKGEQALKTDGKMAGELALIGLGSVGLGGVGISYAVRKIRGAANTGH